MLSQDKTEKIRLAVYGALFLAASVIISIVESVSGINALIPMPGVKLGLCNCAVTACLYMCGTKTAFCIALLRPVFLFVFASNPVSLAMSFAGGMLSFASVVLVKKLYCRVFSFCGISCISAVFHSIGQTAAAMLIMGDGALLYYLPVFCACSCVAGFVSGIVMNIALPRLFKVCGKAALEND